MMRVFKIKSSITGNAEKIIPKISKELSLVLDIIQIRNKEPAWVKKLTLPSIE